MYRKIFSCLALLLMGSMLGVQADEVSYINCTWDSETETVSQETLTTQEGAQIKNSATLNLTELGWTYWYVSGTVTVTGEITVSDEVHLILCDGAQLSCEQGINITAAGILHIHCQSYGDNMGKLIVRNSNKGQAAIGCHRAQQMGSLFIHGGNINAKPHVWGAAIGGGEDADNGPITIYGGKVKAAGGKYASCIGSGYAGSQSGEIDIYGGEVNAYSEWGEYTTGIGAGTYSRGGGKAGVVHIYNATVVAMGGENMAGIGSGQFGQAGKVYIHSGYVSATGGKNAAGIGGGASNSNPSSDDDVLCEIGGGKAPVTVEATGGDNAAGIGGGHNGRFCPVIIHDGSNVTVTSGAFKSYSGFDLISKAIGSGSEYDETDYVNLELGTNLCVYSKPSWSPNDEVLMGTSQRFQYCTTNSYARIAPCSHSNLSYTVDENTHTKQCNNCGYSASENHAYTENVCVCGKTINVTPDYWDVTLYRATAVGSSTYAEHVVMKVLKGQKFSVPAISATQGLELAGYVQASEAPTGIQMSDSETLIRVGDEITPEANTSLYPRYRYQFTKQWTWSDDLSTATLKLTNTTLGVDKNIGAVLSITKEVAATAEHDGYETMTATATYTHNGCTYTYTDENSKMLAYYAAVIGLNNDFYNNSSPLSTYQFRYVNAQLTERSLYKDANWNTLCLPFTIAKAEQPSSPLADATIMEFDPENSKFDSTTGELTLAFTTATDVLSGIPYIVKWSEADAVVSPLFNLAYVDIEEPLPVTSDDGYVSFTGTFAPVTIPASGDATKLFLGAGNKLNYSKNGRTIGCHRAYFQLNGITAIDPQRGVRTMKLLFDDEATAISTPIVEQNPTTRQGWYGLDGRQWHDTPTAKGIYIHNSRKVVVK